jgi:hypothetical protein
MSLLRALTVEFHRVPTQKYALNLKESEIKDTEGANRLRSLNSLSPAAMEAIGSTGKFIDEDAVRRSGECSILQPGYARIREKHLFTINPA